jgi:hypothetical protein
VRGGFTVQNVPKIISSRRSPIRKQLSAAKSADHPAPRPAHEEEEAKPMVASTKFCGILQASARTNQVTLSFPSCALQHGSSVPDPKSYLASRIRIGTCFTDLLPSTKKNLALISTVIRLLKTLICYL